jgi:hypothetical protein
MATRLRAFGQVLPSSSGDLELLRAALAQQAAEHAEELGRLSNDYESQAGRDPAKSHSCRLKQL